MTAETKSYIQLYREANKEKIAQKKKEYREKKKQEITDDLYRLTCDVRSLIGRVFREQKITKNTKTENILGCSFEELKKHLENQFEDWMTWENKGNPKDGIYELNKTWDIDHIIPLSTITGEEDII